MCVFDTQSVSILTRRMSSTQESRVAGSCCTGQSSLEVTGHTRVVRECFLEDMISEQGPGGQGVSRESKKRKSIPGNGFNKCKGPEANMSLWLEQSEQGKRGTGSVDTVATVRTLASLSR